MFKRSFLLLMGLFAVGLAEVFFREDFKDKDAIEWTNRWKMSEKDKDYGNFLRVPVVPGSESCHGIATSNDARFYSISTKFSKTISNKGKPFIIQFLVKHPQKIDCGGGYIKILNNEINQKTFHGETPYSLMFGPDLCGTQIKKVHVIMNYKGKTYNLKKQINAKDDELSHMYTLIISPDNTYEVQIDGEKVESGDLESDFDFLPPKKIPDPAEKKPKDWVDNEWIDDPEDKKPEDFDKPEKIPDSMVEEPEDWDKEMDGEWEKPMIDNPEFKGEWKPKQIKNPDYKGVWEHPLIDNPEYAPDDELYLLNNLGYLGIDIWQVKSGTIFTNFLITDSIKEAKAHIDEKFKPLQTEEKNKEMEDEKQKEELRKMEEEKQKNEDPKDHADDEDEEESRDEL